MEKFKLEDLDLEGESSFEVNGRRDPLSLEEVEPDSATIISKIVEYDRSIKHVLSEAKAQNQKILQMQLYIEKLSVEKQMIRTEYEEILGRHSSLEVQVEELERGSAEKLGEKVEAIKGLQSKIDEVQALLKDAEQRVQDKDSEIDKLTSLLVNTRIRYGMLEKNKEREKAKAVEDRVNQYRDLVERQNLEKAGLEVQLGDLTKTIATLKDEAKSKDESLQEKQAEATELSLMIQDLSDQNKRLSRKIGDVESESRRRLEAVETAKDTVIESLKKRFEETEKDFANRERELIEEIQEADQGFRSLMSKSTSRLKRLKRILKLARDYRDGLSWHKKRVEDMEGEISQLASSREALKSLCRTNEDDIRGYRDEVTALKESLSLNEARLAREVEKVSSLEGRIADVSRELSGRELRVRSLESEVQGLRSEIAAHKSENQELLKGKNEVEVTLRESEKKVARVNKLLIAEREKFESKISMLSRGINEKQEKLKFSQELNDRMSASLESQAKEREELISEVSRLNLLLTQNQEFMESTRENSSRLESQVMVLKEKLREASSERETIEVESKGYKSTIHELESEIRALKAEKDRVVGGLELRIGDLERGYEESGMAKEKLADERRNLDELSSKLKMREDRLKTYIAQIDERSTEVKKELLKFMSELKSNSAVSPLKEYLIVTERELGRLQIVLSQKTKFDSDRPQLESDFARLVEQREEIKKLTLAQARDFESRIARLRSLIDGDLFLSNPPLPPT